MGQIIPRCMLTFACLLIIAQAQSAPTTSTARMEVLEAKYGSGHAWGDVIGHVETSANRFFERVKVDPDALGSHIASHPENQLVVRVRLGDTVNEQRFNEGDDALLLAPSDPAFLSAYEPQSRQGLVILEAKVVGNRIVDDKTDLVKSAVKGFGLTAARGADLLGKFTRSTNSKLVIVYIDGEQIKAHFADVDAPVNITASPGHAVPIAPLSGAAQVTFKQLPIDPATTFAMTPDGKYLVIVHQSANRATVWDVQNEKVIATLQTEKPCAVFCPGGDVYIANADKGAISVFSSQDWKQTDELRVNDSNIRLISGPIGKDFKKQLLVNCDETDLSRRAFVVDAAHDSCRQIEKVDGYAISSMDGSIVLVQQRSAQLQVFSWGELLTKSPQPVAQSKAWSTDSPIQPTRNGNDWLERDTIYAGMPPEPKPPSLKGTAIVDLSQPAVYVIDRSGLTMYSLLIAPEKGPTRLVTFPGDNIRQSLSLKEYAWPKPEFGAYPAAFVHQDKLYLFAMGFRGVIYSAVTPTFTNVGQLEQQMASSAREGELGVPKQVAAGTPLSIKLKTVGKTVELMSGPDGMKLADGTLTWSPTDADAGKHDLKFRVTSGNTVGFVRPTIEVISSAVVTANHGTIDNLANFPKLGLKLHAYTLAPGLNYRSLLLEQGEELTTLKADGLTVDHTAQLPGTYQWIAERDDCYVGLLQNPQALDVIDKKTIKARVHVNLSYVEVTDLAIHPFKRIAYVAVRSGAEQLPPRMKIATIDELTGKITEQPDVVGNHLAVDPSGAMLIATYDEPLGANEAIIEGFHDGILARSNSLDALVQYDIRKGTPKYHRHVPSAGVASGVEISADGKQVLPLWNEFFPSANTTAALGTSELGVRATFSVGGAGGMIQPPTLAAFHPSLNLIALARENVIRLFDSHTGAPQQDRLMLTSDGMEATKIEAILFAPDGQHLIAACNQPGQMKYLRSIALKLSPSEQTIAAKGFVAPAPATTAPAAPTQLAKLKSPDLEALTARGGDTMTPKQISKRFDAAVVVITSGEGSGTGFVLGSKGYVLTCNHVVAEGGDIKVNYFPSSGADHTVDAGAKIVATDPDLDLALLKIDAPKPLTFVTLAGAESVDSGEAVTVIGNPGVGETILSHTMTTGIVSSPRREFDGTSFIQTSAAVNPGNSGGPMFDSTGRVIGIVCLKADIEGAGFALPAARIRDFIKRAADAK